MFKMFRNSKNSSTQNRGEIGVVFVGSAHRTHVVEHLSDQFVGTNLAKSILPQIDPLDQELKRIRLERTHAAHLGLVDQVDHQLVLGTTRTLAPRAYQLRRFAMARYFIIKYK